MSVLSSILIPSDASATVLSSLSAGSSSVEQALGKYQIFAINATQDITIRFGLPGFSTAAGTADFRIPAGSTMVFDLGESRTSFKVYNLGTSACNIYYQTFSKF